MMGFFRRVLNKKGVTLIEMIVAMVVMVIIITAVSSIFAPMLMTYQRASNLAEVNTLLDNISAIIMDDVSRASEILPADPNEDTTVEQDTGPDIVLTHLFRIRTTFWNDYFLGNDGTIWLSVQGLEDPIRILPRDFYRFWGEDETVFRITECDLVVAVGVVTLDIEVTSRDGWRRDRTYTARPIGLVP